MLWLARHLGACGLWERGPTLGLPPRGRQSERLWITAGVAQLESACGLVGAGCCARAVEGVGPPAVTTQETHGRFRVLCFCLIKTPPPVFL